MAKVGETKGNPVGVFDREVWAVIRSIPRGRLMTYGQIARHLGTKAYRAVGRACGKSPGMPDVPCHRVVSRGGFLHGFNGGLEKKRTLLESEGIRLKPQMVKGREDYQVIDFGDRLVAEPFQEKGR